MAPKRQQTMAKRAREQAVRERRERKAQRKADRLAAAAAGETQPVDTDQTKAADEPDDPAVNGA